MILRQRLPRISAEWLWFFVGEDASDIGNEVSFGAMLNNWLLFLKYSTVHETLPPGHDYSRFLFRCCRAVCSFIFFARTDAVASRSVLFTSVAFGAINFIASSVS